jgi:vacuolar-type H+-ATPase catalytic subunit A/Vma1
MATIYQMVGEEEKWWQTMENVAALTPDDAKKNIYEELANLSPTNVRKKKYLDMALQYVMNENTSVCNKCQTTLQIAEELKQIYIKDGDYARLDRINMLIDKTALLLIDDLEQKILAEESREKKIEMEVKLLRFEQRYLKLSEEQHQQRIKHIYSLLKSGEKIRLKEDGQFLYKS